MGGVDWEGAEERVVAEGGEELEGGNHGGVWSLGWS